MALQIYKALARGELCVDFVALQVREGLYQFPRGVRRVEDLFRVGVCRGAVERRGEEPAVAVDYVGASGRERCRHAKPRHVRLRRPAFEQHDLDHPQCDDGKDAGEQNAGEKQAAAAGLDRLLRRSLGNYRRTRGRPEMPRPAGVVVIVVIGLGGNHHRLVMIWAIRSSSDLARWGWLGLTAALAGG